MESRAKVKIRGTIGSDLLRHVESVDPRAAEGLRREKRADSSPDMEIILEEETRRSITDAYQRFLFEVKVLHRKGNFKSSQGEVIVQRIRDIANGGKTALDLAGFLIFDEFVDHLVQYLRSKTCKLVGLNVSDTSLGVQAAIKIAKATNSALQALQFSNHPIPVGTIRSEAAENGHVILSGHNFNHLDAAAIGILVGRERKQIQKLDLSGNSLTGPKANVFHGVTTIFESLTNCRQLQELNLCDANLRSDGLVALANVIQNFSALEKLDLSRNRIAYNSTNEKRLSGVESFCNALWQVKTLRELSLSECQISCEGLSEVATVLRKFNSTLKTFNIAGNPDIRSQGYRSLVKCLSINHKITEVAMNPEPRYEKYINKAQGFLAVNVLLNNVQANPKRFTGFPELTEKQRTNFVDKLEGFSESELRQLHEEQIVENAVQFSNEKETAGLAAMRYYAAMEQYAPLKRLLWYFEVGSRYEDLVERSNNRRGFCLTLDFIVYIVNSNTLVSHSVGLKAGPVTRVCHVCGRQYGLSSFEIHLKQCKKLWVQQEELKPKNERRPIPKTPPGIGEGGGGMTRQEVEALNQAAQEAYNVHGMEKCEFCGRTFAEGRLAIHNKSCRADSVAKKVDEGAVPRNKKGDVNCGVLLLALVLRLFF
ncbi:RNI-like protein [Phytophthora palmivora]|uniref:RNI-like protein n=1 Tax=Phytophthora palmivora TaxID=4796 RepID=A0A2P4X882_9STRA|nr:RNI-like protein [Phytophthora palmivora]